MIHGVIVGSGPVQMVFLHSLFGQGKNFTRITTSLAGVATCHLLDLPNHGASSQTVGLTLDGQSKHMARWPRENLEGPVILVGHSLGGKLAIWLALAHPGLVDRLLVTDISSILSDGPTRFTPLVTAMHSLDLEHLVSRTEANRRLTDVIPGPQTRGFLLWNLRRLGEDWAWRANLGLLGGSLRIIGGWPRMGAVHDGPIWWMVEGQSPYILSGYAGPMRRLLPRAVTIAPKCAGHWVHADGPEAFTSICTGFLTSPATVSSA